MSPSRVKGKRVEIYVGLDPDQVERLDAAAKARRTTRPQIVREALDKHLFLLESIPVECTPNSKKGGSHDEVDVAR